MSITILQEFERLLIRMREAKPEEYMDVEKLQGELGACQAAVLLGGIEEGKLRGRVDGLLVEKEAVRKALSRRSAEVVEMKKEMEVSARVQYEMEAEREGMLGEIVYLNGLIDLMEDGVEQAEKVLVSQRQCVKSLKRDNRLLIDRYESCRATVKDLTSENRQYAGKLLRSGNKLERERLAKLAVNRGYERLYCKYEAVKEELYRVQQLVLARVNS